MCVSVLELIGLGLCIWLVKNKKVLVMPENHSYSLKFCLTWHCYGKGFLFGLTEMKSLWR